MKLIYPALAGLAMAAKPSTKEIKASCGNDVADFIKANKDFKSASKCFDIEALSADGDLETGFDACYAKNVAKKVNKGDMAAEDIATGQNLVATCFDKIANPPCSVGLMADMDKKTAKKAGKCFADKMMSDDNKTNKSFAKCLKKAGIEDEAEVASFGACRTEMMNPQDDDAELSESGAQEQPGQDDDEAQPESNLSEECQAVKEHMMSMNMESCFNEKKDSDECKDAYKANKDVKKQWKNCKDAVKEEMSAKDDVMESDDDMEMELPTCVAELGLEDAVEAHMDKMEDFFDDCYDKMDLEMPECADELEIDQEMVQQHMMMMKKCSGDKMDKEGGKMDKDGEEMDKDGEEGEFEEGDEEAEGKPSKGDKGNKGNKGEKSRKRRQNAEEEVVEDESDDSKPSKDKNNKGDKGNKGNKGGDDNTCVKEDGEDVNTWGEAKEEANVSLRMAMSGDNMDMEMTEEQMACMEQVKAMKDEYYGEEEGDKPGKGGKGDKGNKGNKGDKDADEAEEEEMNPKIRAAYGQKEEGEDMESYPEGEEEMTCPTMDEEADAEAEADPVKMCMMEIMAMNDMGMDKDMGKDKGMDEEFMAAVQAAVVKPDTCGEDLDVQEVMAKMQECMPKKSKGGKKDKKQDNDSEEVEEEASDVEVAMRRRRQADESMDMEEDMDMDMDMDKEEMSEEAKAEMMACMIPEDASVETVTCFTDMQAAIMDAKAAVKAAYEEAMNAQIMAMWPECAADISLEEFKFDMETCQDEAKEEMKADDEDEDVEDEVEDAAEPVEKKKNGGKKDKEAMEAKKDLVDTCMIELGYQPDCLEQIDSAFESAKDDDEEESEESEGKDMDEEEPEDNDEEEAKDYGQEEGNNGNMWDKEDDAFDFSNYGDKQ